MFKVKNKNTRTTGIFIVNFENISHLALMFPIVNFEQVNAGWETDKGYSKKQLLKSFCFLLQCERRT